MRLIFIAAFCGAMGWAGVIDRVALVVGTQVITQSEVMREVRLTEFINGQPLDLSAERRREAAERLVDQLLIKQEMEIGGYTQPAAGDGDAMLRKFRQEHYSSIPQFRAALQKYAINEEDLKQLLLWQLAVMRFTDQRFRSATATPSQESGSATERSRTSPAADGLEAGSSSADVDQQMDTWLKQARQNTRIVFKEGAFKEGASQ